MKKLLLVVFAFVLSTGALLAQTSGIEKSKKIDKDEVPAAIQSSLKENFSITPEDGTWYLQYKKYTEASLVKFKPVAYTFKQKNGKEKVEIRFAPNGTLEQARGIEKKIPTENSGS
jgi:hypothetical protein